VKDHQLREFLGVFDCNGWDSVPISVNNQKNEGMLAYLRERIESLEEYLGILYETHPSHKGYPRHVKETGPERPEG
jgi:hypothetical protein